MPDDRIDPSQNTQAFQAWVDQNQPAQPAGSGATRLVLIAAGVAVVVAIAVALVMTLG